MLTFIVVALVGYSLALGFALEKIITNTLNQKNPIAFLNGLLIYYFFAGFITRFFLQSLPVLEAQPYLHLPVPRRKIVNFLIGRSLVHVINVSVFLLFTPFALSIVAETYGLGQAFTWLLSIWFMSLINHFLVILTKTNVAQSFSKLIIFLIIFSLVAYADFHGWIKLTQASEKLFNYAFRGYTLIVSLALLTLLLYYVVYRTFINKLYPQEIGVQEHQTFQSANWRFLERFGLLGAWANLELKLIFRNKRSRELILMHTVFLLLPLGFYSYSKNHDSYGSLLFFGMISSGFFAMNYGQFLFSWQAGHFDFTLTQPTSIRQFVVSKYWLLAITTVLWFLCSIPYVFLGWHFLLINLAASLYNIGISTFIVMNMSMWGAKKIDLKHSGSLNFEGIGAAQWLMGFPLLAGPYLFYGPLNLLGFPILGIVSVMAVGIIGILLQKPMTDYTVLRLLNRRHLLAGNFRKD